MTVCRYFLRGNCHYGQNCRFEHVYEDYRGGPQNREQQSQYHYNTPLPQSFRGGSHQGGSSSFNFGQAAAEVVSHKTQEIDQLKKELQHITEGHLYPFTVIPGVSPHSNFKHLSDLSPEEIRLKAYENIASNTFQEYQSEMAKFLNHVLQIVRQVIENPQILQDSQPKPGADPIVYHNDQPGNVLTPSSFNANPFSSRPQQRVVPSPPILAGSGVGFGQNMSFPTQAQPPMATHFLSSIPTQGQSFNTAPIVHQPQVASPIAAVNSHGVSVTPRDQVNPQTTAGKQQAKDTTYSEMEKLSPNDLAAFRDHLFSLDNLPLIAPPKELC